MRRNDYSDDPWGPTDADAWRFALFAIALISIILASAILTDFLEKPIHALEKRRALLTQTQPGEVRPR